MDEISVAKDLEIELNNFLGKIAFWGFSTKEVQKWVYRRYFQFLWEMMSKIFLTFWWIQKLATNVSDSLDKILVLRFLIQNMVFWCLKDDLCLLVFAWGYSSRNLLLTSITFLFFFGVFGLRGNRNEPQDGFPSFVRNWCVKILWFFK